jgi:hypothetical protein
MFEPPTSLAQIQKQFTFQNFNSISGSNLNLLPKGKLFLIFHSIRLQSLVNFGAPEGCSYFTSSVQFEKIGK